MARTRKRSANKLPPFVAMVWVVLNSAAYIEMRHYSRVALIYFLGKVRLGYNDSARYKSPFSFPYSEAKRMGFPNSTFAKAIQELVEHGFLDPEAVGGCFGDIRVPNMFTLSNRWQEYGTRKYVKPDWKSFTPKPRKKQNPSDGGKSVTPDREIDPDTS